MLVSSLTLARMRHYVIVVSCVLLNKRPQESRIPKLVCDVVVVERLFVAITSIDFKELLIF